MAGGQRAVGDCRLDEQRMAEEALAERVAHRESVERDARAPHAHFVVVGEQVHVAT